MHHQILQFWFNEVQPSQWWKKDTEFDQLITEKFLELHKQAEQCELYHWRNNARGRLAEIIILDQFSRNIYRDSARAFSCDALALVLAQEAISLKSDIALTPEERSFLYMPFMHSESIKIHKVAEDLFSKNGIQSNIDFELKHKSIIESFGRYPHRNNILGRESTAKEKEFLSQPGGEF